MNALDHTPYQLRVLGGAALFSHAGPTSAVAVRRRLVALLALACAAGRRGITRERAAVALWPDVSDANSRNDLKQLVFVARRAFGQNLFIADAAALIINERVLSSDVSAFYRAINVRRLEDAVGMYAGPFLDGFHIADRPELEHLVEGERVRCARHYAEALEDLAADAELRRDYRAALRWWRHLVAVDPLRDDYATGLMGALADSGELSGALMYARRYAQLVRRELDTDLGAEVAAFVLSLRDRSRSAAHAWRATPDTSAPGDLRSGRQNTNRDAAVGSAALAEAPSTAGAEQWNIPHAVDGDRSLQAD